MLRWIKRKIIKPRPIWHTFYKEYWENCSLESLEKNLDEGVDLNEPSNDIVGSFWSDKENRFVSYKQEITPFHFLCYFKNEKKVIERAIESGANPKKLSYDGHSPLMFYLDDGTITGDRGLTEWRYEKADTVDHKKYGISDSLIDTIKPPPNLDVSKLLIEKGSKLNHQSRIHANAGGPIGKRMGGKHMLFYLISRQDHFELLENLLESHTVDKDTVLFSGLEKNFFTPIGWAIEWRNLRALRLLVKAGFADVSAIETIEGWKPVDPLASLGDKEKKKMQKFINDCKET